MDPVIAAALARQGERGQAALRKQPRTLPLFGARAPGRFDIVKPDAALTGAHLAEAVAAVPFWWHSIDLGDEIVTAGLKSAEHLKQELASLHLPDLQGLSVLDIGAWDGFYSFTAERRGARRVVALDHFAWSIDWSTYRAGEGWPKNMPASGRLEDHAEAWRPELLPGKAGFDLARQALASQVEPVVADFMTLDLDRLGSFDVVLYLGVLYHMEDPLASLRRLRQATDGLAVIESHAIHIPGLEERAFCEFADKDQINNDPTNWWVPNLKALVGLCQAAGFTKVKVVLGPPEFNSPIPCYYRAILHAWK